MPASAARHRAASSIISWQRNHRWRRRISGGSMASRQYRRRRSIERRRRNVAASIMAAIGIGSSGGSNQHQAKAGVASKATNLSSADLGNGVTRQRQARKRLRHKNRRSGNRSNQQRTRGVFRMMPCISLALCISRNTSCASLSTRGTIFRIASSRRMTRNARCNSAHRAIILSISRARSGAITHQYC